MKNRSSVYTAESIRLWCRPISHAATSDAAFELGRITKELVERSESTHIYIYNMAHREMTNEKKETNLFHGGE